MTTKLDPENEDRLEADSTCAKAGKQNSWQAPAPIILSLREIGEVDGPIEGIPEVLNLRFGTLPIRDSEHQVTHEISVKRSRLCEECNSDQ